MPLGARRRSSRFAFSHVTTRYGFTWLLGIKNPSHHHCGIGKEFDPATTEGGPGPPLLWGSTAPLHCPAVAVTVAPAVAAVAPDEPPLVAGPAMIDDQPPSSCSSPHRQHRHQHRYRHHRRHHHHHRHHRHHRRGYLSPQLTHFHHRRHCRCHQSMPSIFMSSSSPRSSRDAILGWCDRTFAVSPPLISS